MTEFTQGVVESTQTTINFDPKNNPIHALRLEYGDVDEYDYILSDESYQYYIDKYPNSPNMVSKSVGLAIAANFARNGFRQRVGQEEAYLSERYKNYMDWLKQRISNPALSGRVPAVYVGGVFVDTIDFYNNNPELVHPHFWKGQHTPRTPATDLRRRVRGFTETKGFTETVE